MVRRLLLVMGCVALALSCSAENSFGHHPHGCWQPVTAYYVPAVPAVPVYAAPAPAAVYRPVVVAAPAVAPATFATTRYRPILGGTVTRVRYGYAPVAPPAYRLWYPLY